MSRRKRKSGGLLSNAFAPQKSKRRGGGLLSKVFASQKSRRGGGLISNAVGPQRGKGVRGLISNGVGPQKSKGGRGGLLSDAGFSHSYAKFPTTVNGEEVMAYLFHGSKDGVAFISDESRRPDEPDEPDESSCNVVRTEEGKLYAMRVRDMGAMGLAVAAATALVLPGSAVAAAGLEVVAVGAGAVRAGGMRLLTAGGPRILDAVLTASGVFMVVP